MTSSNIKASYSATSAQLQALISGLQKQLPSGSFTLVSTAYTTATLVTALQGSIDALTAVVAAHAGVKAALAALATEQAKTGPILSALKRTLQAMYANAPDTLSLFGLQPRKVAAPRTGAQLAASAAKAKATRAARGTVGKKKKLAITGNVTGVTITPDTSPAPSPEPSAQPAPAASTTTPPVATK
jgi:hypothetical protein